MVEFSDDGGTRAWRNNQATFVAVDPTFWDRLRTIPFWKVLLFCVIWGLVGPIGTLIIALTVAYVINAPDSIASGLIIGGGSAFFMLLCFIGSVHKNLRY